MGDVSSDDSEPETFRPGDKVWPREGPMVFQRAPQTVLATWMSPEGTGWLWLDGGTGYHLGSWYAVNWTTEEPDQAEIAAREERARIAADEP